MEDALKQLAERALVEPQWNALLDSICQGSVTLPEFLTAHNQRSLDILLNMARDPFLSEAIDEYLVTEPGYATENGLRILREMAEREFGQRPRFSVLRSGKNITLLCARAKREGGRGGKPMAHNSVIRSIFNSTSKLIGFHLGRAERDRIFADVAFSAEDDSRDVWLSPPQIAYLLEACEAWFRPFVLTALATGMDRAPLMRLCVKDVQLIYDKRSGTWRGTLFVRDKKTDGRSRSVAIADPVCLTLLPLLQGKREDDQVFDGPPEAKENLFRARPLPITAYQVRYWFGKARKKAGLAHVRFKDLRHSFATNALDAGLNVSELQAGLGHKRKETSLIYTKRDVTFDHEAALRVAKQMGLIKEENSYPDQAATA